MSSSQIQKSNKNLYMNDRDSSMLNILNILPTKFNYENIFYTHFQSPFFPGLEIEIMTHV